MALAAGLLLRAEDRYRGRWAAKSSSLRHLTMSGLGPAGSESEGRQKNRPNYADVMWCARALLGTDCQGRR